MEILWFFFSLGASSGVLLAISMLLPKATMLMSRLLLRISMLLPNSTFFYREFLLGISMLLPKSTFFMSGVPLRDIDVIVESPS